MIVGFKTVRSITVQRHTNPKRGFKAFGIERRFELHATKGWRALRVRRQGIGAAELRDAHRGRTQGSSVTFRSTLLPGRISGRHSERDIVPIPITEKMMMRHAWYRRQKEREARAAATEAWNNV